MSEHAELLRQPVSRPTAGQDESQTAGSFRLSPIVVYLVVVGLWLAFGALLMQDAGGAADVWERYRGLPVAVEIGVGLLLLPWVLAVGIWQTDWPLALRLGLDGLLAAVTLVMFFPVRPVAPREAPTVEEARP
jgi:hypothetical protein